MVYCRGQQCTFEVACHDADAVTVCGDGLPVCCPMQRRMENVWFALLILPLGTHTFRYYGRFGAQTICLGQETVFIDQTGSWQA